MVFCHISHEDLSRGWGMQRTSIQQLVTISQQDLSKGLCCKEEA
jgi:hypothetical protein